MEGIRARLKSNASPLLITSAGNLVLNAATWNLVDFELREARYYAAALAEVVNTPARKYEREKGPAALVRNAVIASSQG